MGSVCNSVSIPISRFGMDRKSNLSTDAPIPDKVLTPDEKRLIDSRAIEQGHNIWQSTGGMEVGPIWGQSN
ncbi:hypothetical protein [Gimesia chilikensis]|uniref:hypothetical protein n=1 Tax=Gimesia chilikensis TaxID=2605989 RepID=UPI00396583BC